MAAPQQHLTDEEIDGFIDDLDHDNNGHIDYKELEHKLDEVAKQLAPKPKRHQINHDDEEQGRHEFLRTLIGTQENSIPRSQFAESVRRWDIPSLEQDRKEAKQEDDYLKSMSIWRKLRAYWAVEGPQIAFIALVVAFMLAFGIWQLVWSLT
jgi:dual oxidase